MVDPINEQNLAADKITYGKWSKKGDQFGDEEPLKLLYDMFVSAQPEIPRELDVAEFGSADGVVGEYFSNSLKKDGYTPTLTIIDAIKEHLEANENPSTNKIHSNLLTLELQDEYDLGISRSVLHYFSPESQKVVLRNILNSLKRGGYFLSQNFVQNESDLELYLEFNKRIGKSFQLATEEMIIQMMTSAGFENVRKVGDMPTWHYEGSNLQKRYELSEEAIREMREIILATPEEKRSGFGLTEDSFTVPVPYKVFLARKPG